MAGTTSPTFMSSGSSSPLLAATPSSLTTVVPTFHNHNAVTMTWEGGGGGLGGVNERGGEIRALARLHVVVAEAEASLHLLQHGTAAGMHAKVLERAASGMLSMHVRDGTTA
uniref:Uncharacterized protein n=1 Tax=Oryza rufipogon TaxID=4529 RepID=A0A0E0RCL2_ORYRU